MSDEASPPPIHVTQLIYLREGAEEIFDRFEEKVLPLLAKYRGELVLRLRPGPSALIAGSSPVPYEVHVVRFETEADFTRYSNDEERQRCLPLKEASVRSAMSFKGVRI